MNFSYKTIYFCKLLFNKLVNGDVGDEDKTKTMHIFKTIKIIFMCEDIGDYVLADTKGSLSTDEVHDVFTWLDTFQLSRPRKSIHRDFSDGVLIAELLKQLYPKLVELHNYPSRNSFTLKLDNWKTLNWKILQKLELNQSIDTLKQLCNGCPGALETLLWQIKSKYNLDKRSQYEAMLNNGNNDDKSINSKNDVITINVDLYNNGEYIQQKMIVYGKYEKALETIEEQKQVIAILTQKIEHLDNILKLKSRRIEDLSLRLAKKNHTIQTNVEIEELLTEKLTNILPNRGT